MSGAKHTPTPWRVVRRRDGIGISGLRAVLPLDDQGAADAAFCVRAANAHEALRRALDALVHERNVVVHCPDVVLQQAWLALKLAEGGT